MGETKRQFSEEFKRNAVELSYSGGKTVSQVARDLGISKSVLTRWRAEVAELGERAFPGKGKLTPGTPLEEENRRLRRELAIVQEERDILKKHSWPYRPQAINENVHP